MITLTEIKEIITDGFKECLQPLREISRDSQNNNIMMDSPDRFYSFDKIAQCIYKGQNKPKSPDMIIFKNDSVIFVEFKNGKIHSSDKDKIKLKAIEGGFIVFHKVISKYKNVTFEEIFKLKKSYVLVYNIEKKPAHYIHDHINSKDIRFGLAIYEGTFFHSVRTVSPEEFSQIIKAEKYE